MTPHPGETWRPTASRDLLAQRARIYAQIRTFFAERGVLEVETPLLSAATVTDLHLASFRLRDATGNRDLFLQTSPEFAMKRLVAAGSGPIYQIARAFRAEEAGRFHNPEFSLLEWYRPDWDHHRLMDEMDDLLGTVLELPKAKRWTYGELFEHHLGIDPHRASQKELVVHSLAIGGPVEATKDTLLQLLMTHRIEEQLEGVHFVMDFPASQAALARLRGDGDIQVAERFEVYVNGVELANGFHELADAAEQRQRFEDDLAARRSARLEEPPIDERLLAALASGFPDCAGVALGLDRLVMLATQSAHIDDVLAFPFERA